MKKTLALIIAIAMALGTMSGIAFAEETTVSVWDGTSYSLGWLSAGNPEGTEGEKFYLNSAADLAGFAHYVNTYASTNNIFVGDTVYLNVDVDLDNKEWTPIGTMTTDKRHFYGSFDGQGHTIHNLKISETSKQIYGGFFGRFKNTGFSQTFSDLTFNNVDIASVASSDGKEGAGALMGYGYDQNISGIHVTGNVNISGNYYVGAIAGHARANISNSTVDATGNITAVSTAGGLVGYFVHATKNGINAAIEECSVEGLTVKADRNAGGLVGFVSATNADKIVIDKVSVSDTSVSAKEGNVADVAFNFSNATNTTVENVSSVVTGVAEVDGEYYETLQEAINAADAGDVVTLTANISAEVMPTADSTSNPNNCLIAISAGKVVTLDLNGKTISVKGSDDAQYDTLAIRNSGDLTITDSSADKSGTITLAFDGTQEHGTSQIHSTILNFGTLTINGGNIINTATTGYSRYAIYNYSWGGNAILTINDANVSSDNGDAIIQAIYDDSSKNKNIVTINDGTFSGGVYAWYQNACAPDGASFTIRGGTFTGEEYALRLRGMSSNVLKVDVQGGTFTAPAGVNAIKTDATAKFISGGSFSTNVADYLADGFELTRTADGYDVIEDGTDNPGAQQADSISVEYKDITAADAEGEKIYEIVVKANDGDSINELASADLTFVYTTAPAVGGAIDFTVAPAEKFSMSRVDKTNRYMFNYDGVGAFEGSGNAITIGTIKVEGYGEFTIATKKFDATETDTNIVNATTLNDNLVDSYTAAGADDTDATTGALIINTDTDTTDKLVGSITNGAIAVPTRELTINVAFPNAVEDNVIAYQDMKVEITGNIDGVNKTVTYNLGEDEVAMGGGKYVVTNEDLVLNNAYTVTVSGAGYRTARYTVTMTNNKELNFWNNVMDEDKLVEKDKATSNAKVTFLAGDIVKDNNINIYDLSAVVSYFATSNETDKESDYAKYDLNRDGVIDSKDVAYVLVSWNN